MEFKPLGDNVLIDYEEQDEEKTKGGIIMTTRERPQQGIVVAVGMGKKSPTTGERIPMTVKVGDTVMYAKDMVGDPIKLGDEKYFLISEHQLLGILKK